MYLKRLELHGFKSFATNTTFEFGPGVTCIVGPNGSGKTNIAEAIRWVLGEQASRIIRARRTEDIIFSGSDKRPPLGLAETRLCLENSDHWLPLEFQEVVVARRAYRSGENEYFINRSRVRLRDVTELFLKAQAGQNSYAFMGQGLVEEVLTLRPEERRGLIEEAADVRLHRSKLDEARNRLAATQDNLERISLLVREIEPRLRQLERQADRAATHASLSAELAQALQAWFGEQWREAQEALAAARASCDQRQEESDSARREVETCEDGLRAVTTAIEEHRIDIAGRVESYRNLEEYRRDLQGRIALDDERQRMLATRRDELRADIDALRGERAELTGLVASQEERAHALAEELSASRIPEPESEEAERLEARLHELRQALRQAEEGAARIAARRAEAEARHAALSDQRERLGAETTSLEAARREQIAALSDWARELATRRQRFAELRPEAERVAWALTQTEGKVAAATTNLTSRQEQVRELAVKIESAEARLEVAQATDVDLPAPDAGVRALLAAGGRVARETPDPDSSIQGMVGMLGQLLSVPAGLERAIEAALAEGLHAVVVETQEDALAAVELLVSEDLGRATVFPLADLRPSQPLNLLEERGVIGVASELVRCDHRYRPLVNTLLGRTIVVENLGRAKAVLRRGLGNVVTRDGILLRPQGSMTAGSAKAVRQAFVHQRDVGDLPRELERLRSEQQQANAALEAAERALSEAQQARDRLAPESERLRRELVAAEEALRQQQSRLPATTARLSALHARRDDAQRGLRGAEQALEEAQHDMAAARAKAEDQEASLERLRREVEELTSSREERLRATSARTTRLAALEAEQEALQQLRDSQAATLARIERELSQREETSVRLDEELGNVRGRLEATRQELEEKSEEAETARGELEPARRALEQIESRQRELNDELAAARTRALEAERALLDAEANVRLRSEELEALRGRLQEEGFATSPEGEVVPVNGGEGPPAWLASDPPAGGELPPMRGGTQVDPVALKERITELRAEIRSLGPVNEQAQADFAENRERYDYLSGHLTDLREAEASLQEAIVELEGIIKERFSATFRQVNAEFKRYFETFFGGGHAELLLTKPDEYGLPGVDISAQPPRKRLRTLAMLSGGERSLTAVALLFALLQTRPSPICVLDEVDAALDEANVERFTNTLRELAERTQFIIITHNRRTIEMADTIYGISMGEDSTSSVLSLRLSDIPEN